MMKRFQTKMFSLCTIMLLMRMIPMIQCNYSLPLSIDEVNKYLGDPAHPEVNIETMGYVDNLFVMFIKPGYVSITSTGNGTDSKEVNTFGLEGKALEAYCVDSTCSKTRPVVLFREYLGKPPLFGFPSENSKKLIAFPIENSINAEPIIIPFDSKDGFPVLMNWIPGPVCFRTIFEESGSLFVRTDPISDAEVLTCGSFPADYGFGLMNPSKEIFLYKPSTKELCQFNFNKNDTENPQPGLPDGIGSRVCELEVETPLHNMRIMMSQIILDKCVPLLESGFVTGPPTEPPPPPPEKKNDAVSPSKAAKKGGNGMMMFFILLVLVGAGAGAFIMMKNKKGDKGAVAPGAETDKDPKTGPVKSSMPDTVKSNGPKSTLPDTVKSGGPKSTMGEKVKSGAPKSTMGEVKSGAPKSSIGALKSAQN